VIETLERKTIGGGLDVGGQGIDAWGLWRDTGWVRDSFGNLVVFYNRGAAIAQAEATPGDVEVLAFDEDGGPKE